MTDTSDDARPAAEDASSEPLPLPPSETEAKPSARPTMAERIDAALAAPAPAHTVLGGVGLPHVPAPETALMHTDASAVREARGALTGRTIKGRYLAKRLLGEGGMGGVYEAEHLEIGKRVAIKIVASAHARDPHIAARIKQEARSTSAIESEHIVQVFDAGEDDEVGLFLVMELLKGEDLSALLARQVPRWGLPPALAVSLMAQAARGLSRAHAAGIVHRDLKPANIFICTRDDGSSLVKLVDFGIAKLLRDARDADKAGLTRMGMVIGTPQYMSREQAQGLPTVDHRTDIYSLGAVLFEVITGQAPYAEMPTYEQTILQIMMNPAPRISSIVPAVHPAIDQLCADMMAHDPSARPQEMSDVRDRLLKIGAELGVPAPASVVDVMGTSGAFVARDSLGEIRGSIEGVEVGFVPERARQSLPGTDAAVTVDPPLQSEEVPSIAGLSRKRSGGPMIGVAIAVAAVAAGVFVFRSHDATTATSAGSGLVDTRAPSPAVEARPTPVVASAPAALAAPPASPGTPSATPTIAAPAASAAPALSAVTEAPKAPASHHAAPAPHKVTPHRVGATEMVDDF